MKSKPFFVVAFLALALLAVACGPADKKSGQGESADGQPVAGVINGTDCYAGPATVYGVVLSLDVGQYYQVVGIDDDIAWIDDDIAWLQIDLTQLIDPDPPHAPLNELSPQPDPPGSVKRCWVPAAALEFSGDLDRVPVVEMPVVEILNMTGCYYEPGTGEETVRRLDGGGFYRLMATDDNVTWIDDDIAWLDAGNTWFQIDPTAIVDPNPPHRPLAGAAGQTEMRLRCWVPASRVTLRGDLGQVPIIEMPYIPPPRVRVGENASCRSGPSTEYNVLSYLPAGNEYEIHGQDRAGAAWLIFDPAIDGPCWVNESLVEVIGDAEMVGIVDPDPPSLVLPTDTPVPQAKDCSQYNTNPPACGNDPACWWDPSVPPNGVCKNK